MKKTLLIAVALSMMACGTTKKNTTTYRSLTEAEITITETIDTTITLPPLEVVTARPLAELIEVGHMEATDGPITVRVEYDKTTNQVRARGIIAERSVPVKAERTTSRTYKHQANVEKKELDRKTTGGFSGGIIFTIAIAAVIAIALLVFKTMYGSWLPFIRKSS